MKRRARITLAVAGATAWGVTQLPWPGPGPAQAAVFAVSASGTRFSPSSLTIQPGDSVQWSNQGESHNVTADDGSFATITGFSFFERTFPFAGTFNYRCTIHAGLGMTGTITVLAPGQTTTSSTAPPGPVVPAGASAFLPLPPTRIIDTRPGEPTATPKGIVAAGATLDARVTGVGGVPAGATAVALNITATASQGPGFVTAFPRGLTRPLASTLNITAANQTVPNFAIVPVGANGEISLYTSGGAHLVGDVAGYFVGVFGPVSNGRFAGLTPSRVFDTRPSEAAPGPKGVLPASGERTFAIRGVAGVPTSGVSAVALNVTATDTTQRGFVTVWPSGTARPLASVLNLGANDTKANLVVVPLGADGAVSVFMEGGGHVLADVVGFFSDATATAGVPGLFVPVAPFRAFDTRPSEPAPGFKGFVVAGGSIDTPIAGIGVVPASGVGAVALNLTAADAGGPGFVTAWPSGLPRPLASTLNLTAAGETRANAALLALGGGRLTVFTQPGSHLLGDVLGYFAA